MHFAMQNFYCNNLHPPPCQVQFVLKEESGEKHGLYNIL